MSPFRVVQLYTFPVFFACLLLPRVFGVCASVVFCVACRSCFARDLYSCKLAFDSFVALVRLKICCPAFSPSCTDQLQNDERWSLQPAFHVRKRNISRVHTLCVAVGAQAAANQRPHFFTPRRERVCMLAARSELTSNLQGFLCSRGSCRVFATALLPAARVGATREGAIAFSACERANVSSSTICSQGADSNQNRQSSRTRVSNCVLRLCSLRLPHCRLACRHPLIDRARSAHLNDLEVLCVRCASIHSLLFLQNLVPFLGVGFLYVRASLPLEQT